jgi:hypothetical protein
MSSYKNIVTEFVAKKNDKKSKNRAFLFSLIHYFGIIQNQREHVNFLDAIHFLDRRDNTPGKVCDYIDYYLKIGSDLVPLGAKYGSDDLACKGVSLYNTTGSSWTTFGKGRSGSDDKFLADCEKIVGDRNSRLVMQESMTESFTVDIDSWKKKKIGPMDAIDILRLDLLIAVARCTTKKKKENANLNEYLEKFGLTEFYETAPTTPRNIAMLDTPEAQAILNRKDKVNYNPSNDISPFSAIEAVFSAIAPEDAPETEYSSSQIYLHQKNFLPKNRKPGDEVNSSACCTFTTIDSHRLKESNVVSMMNNARKKKDARGRFLNDADDFIYYAENKKAKKKEYYLTTRPLYFFALHDKQVLLKMDSIELGFTATCGKQGTCKAVCNSGEISSFEMVSEKKIKGILDDDSDDEELVQLRKNDEDDEELGRDDFSDEDEDSTATDSLLETSA